MDGIEFDDLITTLKNSGENERIEAKQTASSPGKSLLQTISAFSNEPGMGGGYLVLGLTKNEVEQPPYYSVTGIKDPEQMQSEVVNLCRQCFNMPIRPSLEVLEHQDKKFLLIYIPEAEPHDKPVYIQSEGIDKGSFRRIGPTDQRCTREDINYLYQQRSRKKYDETLVENASFADFDPGGFCKTGDRALLVAARAELRSLLTHSYHYGFRRDRSSALRRHFAYRDREFCKSLPKQLKCIDKCARRSTKLLKNSPTVTRTYFVRSQF